MNATLIGMTTTHTTHYGHVLQKSTPLLLKVLAPAMDQNKMGSWVRADLIHSARLSFRGWLMYHEEPVSRDLHDRGLVFHASEITLSVEDDVPVWMRFANHEEVMEWHHRIRA